MATTHTKYDFWVWQDQTAYIRIWIHYLNPYKPMFTRLIKLTNLKDIVRRVDLFTSTLGLAEVHISSNLGVCLSWSIRKRNREILHVT